MKVFVNEAYTRTNPDDKIVQIIKEIVAQSYANRKGLSLEKEIENHFLSFSSVLLGDPDQVLVSMEDISNTKELERIKKIEQIRTEFVANISHELRTPLAAIKAYAETIRDSFSSLDEETSQQFMGTILEQSEHLEALLDRLLDFSKLENHTMQLEFEDFNIFDTIAEVRNTLQKTMEEGGVSFSVEADNDKLNAHADKARIRQVLMNLLTNAVKYRDQEKPERWAKIRVSEDAGQNRIRIDVEDNGIGIPQEYHTKVFEKFYRVDSSLTYKVDGTGLGLAITKEILDKHHETITVDSEPGKGSCFSFSLQGPVA